MTAASLKLTFASNHGVFGGGEVMLFAAAEAARAEGHDVTIVAPRTPGDVVEAAERRRFRAVGIAGESSTAYLANLRRWDARHREGVLWCNGLRPALATAGHRSRVVHLHQEPAPRLGGFARLARKGSLATIVPSEAMASRIPAPCVVLPNWTDAMSRRAARVPAPDGARVLGYIGRLSMDKGVDVLVEAVKSLASDGIDVKLLLAGDSRFVDASEAAQIDHLIASLGPLAERRGWMDRSEFFAAVDLAVFPSVWREPFGLVVAEAMGTGCPFVVSDAGALPEVVGPDYPYVAVAGSVDSLVSTIRKALDSDVDAAVEGARMRWEQLYSPERGQERLRALLARFASVEGNV